MNIPVQKRTILFVRRDGKLLDGGFKSKAEANEWIYSLDLDWRAGFVFKIKGDTTDMQIVNKSGVIIKAG